MTELETSFATAGAATLSAFLLVASPAGAAPPREMPSFSRATEWLNSPALTAAALRGKVVLVQFGTFTCINWLRTLPYVRAWTEKYESQGLIVVGVHSPEFEVEKNLQNVRRAVRELRLDYPIVVDNDFAIWRAYDNHYWPALYLADAEGRIRHHQFGEGGYEQTEKIIQRLLAEAGNRGVSQDLVPVDGRGAEAAADWESLRSPENYVGSERTENFDAPASTSPGLNHWSMRGDWAVGKQSIVLRKANGRIVYRFHARDLHLVMGAARGTPVRMRVLIDGRPPGAAHGIDVDAQGNGVVAEPRLYQLIRQPNPLPIDSSRSSSSIPESRLLSSLSASRPKPTDPRSFARKGILMLQVMATSVVIAAMFSTTHHGKEFTMSQFEQVAARAARPVKVESGQATIRPFNVKVPEAQLIDLRRRIVATRWPDKETVADASQGAQLAKLQELVRYWGTDYDWRKAEAKLNALPQFVTKIDGVDIHFIHVRSRHSNAMPVIITHGWPGSVFEQIKLVGPLTDPTKYGGLAEDAFDVVIPSLPGFGFSERPSEAGWGLERIGNAWGVLMKRLGYARYVAQGGDWGAGVVQAMGVQAPAGLLGIHTNFPAVINADVGAALGGVPAAVAALSEKERSAVNDLGAYVQNGGLAYLTMMGARPQAVGYGVSDSPAGLAAWMLQHSGFTKWTYGKDPTQSPTRDDVLDNFSLYWMTNTAASSARIYWENRGRDLISSGAQKTAEISVPVAITVFPDEVLRAQEAWARRAFPNLIYFNEVDRGGHFAMWEYPELFAAELRAAFKSLR